MDPGIITTLLAGALTAAGYAVKRSFDLHDEFLRLGVKFETMSRDVDRNSQRTDLHTSDIADMQGSLSILTREMTASAERHREVMLKLEPIPVIAEQVCGLKVQVAEIRVAQDSYVPRPELDRRFDEQGAQIRHAIDLRNFIASEQSRRKDG